jgi:hypothetical protein
MAAETDLQTKLDDLLGRVATLGKTKDKLIRDAAALEERRDAALAELTKLGYDVADTDAAGLEKLRLKVTGELEASLDKLSELVKKGEELVNQAGY